ncbi:MAG: hypothetical protein WDZ49_15750 [Litorilinea sp.]
MERSEAELENGGMTHHVSPQLLLAYAHVLYQNAPVGWLLTVPGHSFGFGAPFSTETAKAISAIVSQAADIWRAVQDGPPKTG